MKTSRGATEVLTIRVSRALDRRLSREARKRRQTRSETARALLQESLRDDGNDPDAEARRQSTLASRQDADAETLAWLESIADDRGWK